MPIFYTRVASAFLAIILLIPIAGDSELRGTASAKMLGLSRPYFMLAIFAFCAAPSSCLPAAAVHKVHLAFSHHLDVGLDLPLKLTTDCVGFATKIVQRYFDVFIPRALKLADEMRAQDGTDRFRYQIHSWIASLYVDCVAWSVHDGCAETTTTIRCPTASAVAAFDAAATRGDIVFTASPFNIDPEVCEPSLFQDLPFSVAGQLERRYNLTKQQRVWSNVDVKGFARSAIPLLKKAGVNTLYVGTNGGRSPPSQAKGKGLQPVVGDANATIFRWHDPPSGESVTVLYSDGYGSYKPGQPARADTSLISPNGVALVSYYASDNEGPPISLAAVNAVFKHVKSIFPDATVVGSSFDAFAAEALTAEVLPQLPSSSLDWGDQWLTGMSTDPWRLAVFRLMARARADCIAARECTRDEPALLNFTRFLAKATEHTQGVQGEDWSPGIAGPNQKVDADTAHWSNEEFEKVHNEKLNKFSMGDNSWIEARAFNNLALAALNSTHPLRARVEAEMPKLLPMRPSLQGLTHMSIPVKQKGGQGETKGGQGETTENSSAGGDIAVSNGTSSHTFRCGAVQLAFGSDGAVIDLDFGDGIGWVSSVAPMVALTYVTYNQQETWDTKHNLTCDQPGCANPEDRVWAPTLMDIWYNATAVPSVASAVPATMEGGTGGRAEGGIASAGAVCRLVTKAKFVPEASTKYGAPMEAFVEYTVRESATAARPEQLGQQGQGEEQVAPVVEVRLTWFNKSTTRLPESLMLGFSSRPAPHKREKVAENSAGSTAAMMDWALDVLGEWVHPHEVSGVGTTNQLQRGVWKGVKYMPIATSTKGSRRASSATAAAAAATGAWTELLVETLDAGMACLIVPSLGLLGNSTPIGEGVPRKDTIAAGDTTGRQHLISPLLLPFDPSPLSLFRSTAHPPQVSPSAWFRISCPSRASRNGIRLG
jgi:hypothetical protein